MNNLKIDEVENVLPYGDRSGEIIEPWLMDQWYVNAKQLAKPTIEAVKTGQMKFIPKNWENTFFEISNIVENQFLGGQPEKNYSLLCNAHMTRKSKLNIVPRTQ